MWIDKSNFQDEDREPVMEVLILSRYTRNRSYECSYFLLVKINKKKLKQFVLEKRFILLSFKRISF